MKNQLKLIYAYSLLILGWQLAFVSIINAQSTDRLHFERYTIENGLSSDRIKEIVQDQSGYIWIATESGLNRYDGYDFFTYNNIPGDSSSISNNFINVVFVDRNGEIWAGTNSGLNRYNRAEDSFERFFFESDNSSSLPGNSINEVFESTNGDLWIGTNNGLSMYNPQNQSFINEWELEGGLINFRGIEITSISEDDSGTLWIGSSNRGLITFNPQESSIRYYDKDPIPGVSFPTNSIGKIYIDSFGMVWISFLTSDILTVFIDTFENPAGLGRLDPNTNAFTLFKYDEESQPEFWEFVSDITETQDSTLWVTSYFNGELSGAHRFDRETERFKLYSYDPFDPYSLTWPYATAIFEDQFNNLWVGTSRGLNKADLNKWIMKTFEVRPDAPDLLLDNFYGIEEVEDDIFWLGLDGTGLIEWDRNTGEITHYGTENPYSLNGLEDISYGNISLIKKDQTGTVWIGYSGNGIARVNPQTKETIRYTGNANDEDALSGNYITGIWVDDTNTVWFSTTNGLNRYNRDSDTFTSWTTDNSKLPSNSLSTIFKDSSGNFWLGTKKHTYDISSSGDFGLIKFDPATEAVELYQHDRLDANSLSNDAINVIAEDADGLLWIGTDNGLNRFNTEDKSFEQYHVRDGLSGNVIVGMLFDNNGILWMSTLKGLSRFDSSNESFRNYDKDDGAQENRFNDYSYYKTNDGELIFGGVSGANYFYPSESFEVSSKPLINLTDVLVNNASFQLTEPLEKTDIVELDWSENSVGFEFSAIHFRNPEQTEYEYKLEGYDDQWISSGTRRYANYTNLAAGNYTFLVKAINEEGETSVENASLSIRVNPPLWNTWWAYGFYFLLFCAGVFAVDRIQRRRVLYKEKERAREKELKQAKQIEEAYKELEKSHKNLKEVQEQLIQQEKLASLGQLTAGIAHEIKNPLNFVNNFSDLSSEMIEELIEALKTGDLEEAESLAVHIDQNLKKIHEHGSRADKIVHSMLQHSQGSDAELEPADLNSLIKEYVNLAYHGMRAGNDAINVDIDLHLDQNISKVPLKEQDFSRVILNLVHNSFDAMREKEKLTADGRQLSAESGHKYQPRLSIRTIKQDSTVSIHIEDNGPGIPDDIKDKVMQPFFTTKKGTQGTGLGLSISHDIIKAHGGRLEIDSVPGKGTTFTIHIEKRGHDG